MKRLLILLLSLSAMQASAALNLLFRGDLESGKLNVPGTGGVVDYFYQSSSELPKADGSCLAGINSLSKYPATRLVTSPAMGNYAAATTLYWGCDYRPVNAGGYQKPRAAIQATHPNVVQSIGHTYWYSFAIYLPEDWISETLSTMYVNLWQSHKSKPRTEMSLVNIGEGQEKMRLSITDITEGGVYSANAQVKYEWATNRGEWNRFIVHFKPCYTTNLNDTACGFLKVYLSNAARRAAGTASTPIYSGTGKNMESATSTIIDLAGNLYKYNWHCRQSGNNPPYPSTSTIGKTDNRLDYGYCMQNPPPSQTATYISGQGTANPVTAYFDNINLVEDTASATLSEAIAVLDPTFADIGTQTPALPTITRMNQDKPLTPNSYSYWTSNGSSLGAWGLYDGSISDGINSEALEGVASNAGGGCVTIGNVSSVSGGAATVTMIYDTPYFAASRGSSGVDKVLQDWVAFNIVDPGTKAFNTGDPCFNRIGSAVTVENNTASNGLLNMHTNYGIDDHVTGDKITGMFESTPGVRGGGGVNDKIRARIDCTSGRMEVAGTLGALDGVAPSTATTGTGHVVREKVSRGHSFLELEFTANNGASNPATDVCVLKVGPNQSTAAIGDNINVVDAMMWKNRTPHVMTYQTSLSKPDTLPPSLSECGFSVDGNGIGSLGCVVSEKATLYAVVKNNSTEPTDDEIIAGTGFMWAGSVATNSGNASLTTSALDPSVDKYPFFVAVDDATLKSTVYAGDPILAEVTTGVKKLKLGTPLSKITRNGVPATFKYTSVKVYDKNPATDRTAQVLVELVGPYNVGLQEYEGISVVDGIASATEADVLAGSGSLNALANGTYWVLSSRPSNGTLAISLTNIQLVTE